MKKFKCAKILSYLKKFKDKNDEYYAKIAKAYEDIDYTIFSSVLLLIFISSIISLYIFQHNAWYLITEFFSKRQLKSYFGIEHYDKLCTVPRFHISVIWWINLWIVVICGLAIVTKITNNPNWLLFAF